MGLNATVTPGLTVTSSTVLSAANLNLLGTPTISITGSIDSSDIGANTVGSSEIQANAVTQTEIGNIGGKNWILRGDASSNGEGISTLAQDDNGDTQISLLVNDKTDLKPRVITGNLDVTTSGANKLNFAIKENAITGSMIQNLSGKITINDIQPGGGISGNGGVANISASGVTGGLIVFNPNAPTATIDGDPYYGKPQVLQPSGADQYLKSVGTKGELTFGTLAGYPAAIVSAYAQAHVDHDVTATSGPFNKMYSTNVHMVRRIGLPVSSPTVQYGVLRVFFSGGVANGNTVHVFGIGISNHAEHQMMPAVVATAGQLQIDANGDEDTTDGTTYPFVDVKFIRHISSGHPKDQTGGFLQNPNFVQLTFYVS